MSSQKKPFSNGEQVTTSFFPKDKNKIRTVTRCYPSIMTESGWLVDTQDDNGKILKALDPSWYKPIKNNRA